MKWADGKFVDDEDEVEKGPRTSLKVVEEDLWCEKLQLEQLAVVAAVAVDDDVAAVAAAAAVEGIDGRLQYCSHLTWPVTWAPETIKYI